MESKRILYSRIQGNYPRTVFNDATRAFRQAFPRDPTKQDVHVGLGQAKLEDAMRPNKPEPAKPFGGFAIKR